VRNRGNCKSNFWPINWISSWKQFIGTCFYILCETVKLILDAVDSRLFNWSKNNSFTVENNNVCLFYSFAYHTNSIEAYILYCYLYISWWFNKTRSDDYRVEDLECLRSSVSQQTISNKHVSNCLSVFALWLKFILFFLESLKFNFLNR